MEQFNTVIRFIVPTDTNGHETRLTPLQVVSSLLRKVEGATLTVGYGYWQGVTEKVYIVEHWRTMPEQTAVDWAGGVMRWIGGILCQQSVSYTVNGTPYVIDT